MEDQIDDISRFDSRAIRMSETLKKKLLKHASIAASQKGELSTVFQELTKQSINMLFRPNGASLSELRLTLQNLIDDNKLVERYYAQWTHDIYSSYHNAAGNEVRIQLGLRFAVYTGGIMEATRDFCYDKDGQVYSEEEIMAWANETWKGKPKTGYDPVIDVGGYNCRHTLRWISDELAYQLRPELRELFPPQL